MTGQALEWWLKEQNKFDGSNVFTRNGDLIDWGVNGVTRPNQNQINSIIRDYQTYLVQEKISRRNRKRAKRILFT